MDPANCFGALGIAGVIPTTAITDYNSSNGTLAFCLSGYTKIVGRFYGKNCILTLIVGTYILYKGNQRTNPIQEIVMDQKAKNRDIRSCIAESAFQSPVTELDLPASVHNLLVTNGYSNTGDLVIQMKTDEEVILRIRGIGPKILEQIVIAIKQYETPEKDAPKEKSPSYNTPVPSLADYYKPPLGNNIEPSEEVGEEDKDEKTPVYNSPVPSLADYYDPDSIITSVNPMKASAITVISEPKTPKKKNDKKKKKKAKKAIKEKKVKKKKLEKKQKPKKKASKKSKGKKKK